MIRQRLSYQLVSIVWILILVGCGTPATPIPMPIPPTSSLTLIPPVATETPIPATATLTSIPPTASPMSTTAPTPRPGYNTIINPLDPETKIVDIFLAREMDVKSQPTLPQIFPSDVSELFIVFKCEGNMAVCIQLTNDSDWIEVIGDSGPLEIEKITENTAVDFAMLSMDGSSGVALAVPLKPISGKLPDGTYQATIRFRSTTIAQLRWTIGKAP